MIYDTNINGVRLCYALSEDRLVFVGVRGSAQDLTPILDAGVIAQIGEQVKAARDFNEECQRKDESGEREAVIIDATEDWLAPRCIVCGEKAQNRHNYCFKCFNKLSEQEKFELTMKALPGTGYTGD